MKKKLLQITLILLVLFFILHCKGKTSSNLPDSSNLSKSIWFYIGNSGFSPGIGEQPHIYIYEDTIFVAYYDYTCGGSITVKKYNGQEWVLVGKQGFTSKEVARLGLWVSSKGIPYIAYSDSFQMKIRVMKFDGEDWVDTATPGFSQGKANYVTIAGENDIPYIVFTESGTGLNGKISIMKYENSTWSYVGTPMFSNTASWPSIAVNNGNIYIIYIDQTNGNKPIVLKYNGTAWDTVGQAYFTKGEILMPRIIIDQGIIYINYKDFYYGGNPVVMKYNGTKWVYIANPGNYDNPNSAENPAIYNNGTMSHSFYVNNGKIYATYREIGSRKLSVLKYDGIKWNKEGLDYVMNAEAGIEEIFVYKNTPFIVFGDFANANGKLSVMTEGKTFIDNFRRTSPPVFSLPSGSYLNNQTIQISTPTPNAIIRYTLNGSSPSRENGIIYSGPVEISKTTTIKAFAYLNDWADSDISKGEYVLNGSIAKPSFSPDPGIYNSPISVTLTHPLQGVIIKYTIDGSTPSRNNGLTYINPISVGNTMTIKTMAYKDGSIDADISSGDYIIKGWKYAGDQSGFSENSVYNSMKIDSNGNLYVVYMDTSQNKLVSKKLSGNSWMTVGSSNFSADRISTQVFRSIPFAVDNNKPYAAYWRNVNGTSVTGEVYYFDGSNWNRMSNAGFVQSGPCDLGLAVSGGTVYLASNAFDSNFRAGVKKWNGTSWTSLGSPAISIGQAIYISLYIENGNLYIGYLDEGDLNRVWIKKWNSGTNTWDSMGGSIQFANCYVPAFQVYNGVPYVTFTSNDLPYLAKLVGGSWIFTQLSTVRGDLPSIAIDNSGIVYVAYSDSNKNFKATVKKWNGSELITLGEGITENSAALTSLQFFNNTLYLGYLDAVNTQMRVMKFE